MSPMAIVVLALALAVARRLARLALRIVLLIAVIAVIVSNGAPAARRNRRTVPRTPATQPQNAR